MGGEGFYFEVKFLGETALMISFQMILMQKCDLHKSKLASRQAKAWEVLDACCGFLNTSAGRAMAGGGEPYGAPGQG